MKVSPLQPPTLRDDLPRYPQALQLLRVTDATVPGPTGGASTGPGVGTVPPTVLYVSSVQQLRTDTLAPRDREPCLATDPNNIGLTAGYYLARLAGTYNGLPVYEVPGVSSSGGGGSGTPGATGPMGPAGSSGLLPGLTPEQLAKLNASLTPTQLGNLNNLNACQLQVLMQLPVVNVQMLTSDLNQTEVGNIVDGLNFTQLNTITTQTPRAQVVVAASANPVLYQAVNQALTPTQALSFLNNLSSQQFSTLVNLSAMQLQTVAQLSTARLVSLTNLTPTQVGKLVGQLSTSQLDSMLGTLSTSQLQQLTNNLTPFQIQRLAQGTTVSQMSTLVSGLTPAQLIALTAYPSATINALVGGLSIANLIVLLNISGPPAAPVLGAQNFFPAVPAIVGQPSSAPNPQIPGYAPLVVDANNGKVWAYIGGAWASLTFSQLGGTLGPTQMPGVQTVPLGSTISSLPGVPTWYKVRLTFANFSVASTTRTINLLLVPAGTVVSSYKLKHSTSFAGGAIGAYSLSCGTSGSTSRWSGAAFNVFQPTGAFTYVYNNIVSYSSDANSTSHTGTTQLNVTANSGGANLNAATAGVADLWIQLSSAES